jgi:uncharacterized protein
VRLADVNFWLAQAILKHEFHEAAKRSFLEESEAGEWLFCRATQHSFLRLLTTGAVFKPYGSEPLTNRQAWEVYDGILASSRVLYGEEPPELERHWKELGVEEAASPKVWMDAYLAAFAKAGGHKLVTTDAGFRRFEGLELEVLGVENT